MELRRQFDGKLRRAVHLLRDAGVPGLPAGWGAFPRSHHATALLSGLSGIEIGGSAHNDYGLNMRNVDTVDHISHDTIYAREQKRLCGRVLPVDIIAPGNCIPMADASTDFVLASHVIEHFYDPIEAIVEWVRVANRYVYIVVPHRDRTFDRTREPTTVEELRQRHGEPTSSRPTQDQHWSVWRTADFKQLIESLELPIYFVEDVDDKVGNGFVLVIGDLDGFDRASWIASLQLQLRLN